MIIDKAVVFFGFVRRVIWIDYEQKTNVNTWRMMMETPHKTVKNAAALFATRDKKTLYFIPWVKPVIEPIKRGHNDLKRVYKIWSKREADEQIQVWYPPSIKKLDHYGFIHAIEYTSDKIERKTDQGEYHLYTHDFLKDRPLFINCALSPYFWGVHSETPIISWRGIIG